MCIRKLLRQRESLSSVWLRTHVLLTLLFFGFFIAFVIGIAFTRLDRNMASLLERTQTIAWLTVDGSFATGEVALDALMAGADDLTAVSRALDRQVFADIWFVTDETGQILQTNLIGGSVPRPFRALAVRCAEVGQTIRTFEALDLSELAAYSPWLAHRALVANAEPGAAYGALFQVLAVPYRPSDAVRGAVVVARLLNNDTTIADQVQSLIPDSFSTIAVAGVRIAGNLRAAGGPLSNGIGQRQDERLVATVTRGERYIGRVTLSDGVVYLVVSDPIRNSQGEVIGGLSTGHPSQGLATLKRDAAAYTLASAILSLAATVMASLRVSRRLSRPIVQLADIVRQLSEAEKVKPEHIEMLKGLPAPRTREMVALQNYFLRATIALYQKNQEILGYVKRIERDRNSLRQLANRLKHLNETLEAQVEEKTLELRVAMLDLMESNKLKDKLLANVSHDLRTPLNAIIGFSVALLNGLYGELSEQQRVRVQIIHESASDLLRLINDLLDISVLAQGQLHLDLQEIDVHDVILAVAAIIRQQCEQKGVQLSLELAHRQLVITADPIRIKQVLYNLLSNSVKFTPTGGTITVRTSSGPEGISIMVMDTGVGIAEADLYHVFDEFYQAENVATTGRGGVGLGLPLAKRLVEAHGGRIELQSRVGQGTTVTVHLPFRAVDPSSKG